MHFCLPRLFRTIKSTSISDRGGLTKDWTTRSSSIPWTSMTRTLWRQYGSRRCISQTPKTPSFSMLRYDWILARSFKCACPQVLLQLLNYCTVAGAECPRQDWSRWTDFIHAEVSTRPRQQVYRGGLRSWHKVWLILFLVFLPQLIWKIPATCGLLFNPALYTRKELSAASKSLFHQQDSIKLTVWQRKLHSFILQVEAQILLHDGALQLPSRYAGLHHGNRLM